MSPGSLEQQELSFRLATYLYSSENNAGAMDVAHEMLPHFSNLFVTQKLSTRRRRWSKGVALSSTAHHFPSEQRDGPSSSEAGASLEIARKATYMLLYLNDWTFAGSAGELLAMETRFALQTRYPIVLIHEKDENRGGCEFDSFFETVRVCV